MILSNSCLLINLLTVLIIFISALLITTNRRGSVVSVQKDGLDQIVIRLFVFQIYE